MEETVTRQRLEKDERIKQILSTAREVFLEKGYSNTTMTDIIKASGMSRGGVYHYYQNTSDMLFDLMLEGNALRMEIISTQIVQVVSNLSHEAMVLQTAELIVDKILSDNDYTPLYLMFLQEKKHDKKLQALYEEIMVQTIAHLRETFGERLFIPEGGTDRFEFLSEFINAMALSRNILQAEAIFLRERALLVKMIELILK